MMSKQYKIKVSDKMKLGELNKHLYNAVTEFGTEATVSLHVGLGHITLTPVPKERKVEEI
jgi:hypothetical protein